MTSVFDIARALDVLHHALALNDPELALLAGAQLRTAVAELEQAYERLSPADRVEVTVLAEFLRRRREALVAALPALTALDALLERLDPDPCRRN